MKVEVRVFSKGRVRHLLLLPETVEEHDKVDYVMGDKDLPIQVTGLVNGRLELAGCGRHYIQLWKKG